LREKYRSKAASHTHIAAHSFRVVANRDMKPGPPPKPTILKELAGNPGCRPLNKREPKPRGQAKCPPWLLAEAKAEWKRIFPELMRLGLATLVDQAALAGYCQAFAHWVESEKVLAKRGCVMLCPSGYELQRPEVAMAQKFYSLMHRAAMEFGFTPASRSRIEVGDSVDDDKDTDNPDLRLLG
jgi:P27 family predicted phage terminase small subunit